VAYPFFILYSLSQTLQIFLSVSHSFLLVAGWWKFCDRLFLPPWESQNIRIVGKVVFLRLGKTWYVWHPEPNIAGHRDRTLQKPIKTELPRENRDKVDPCHSHMGVVAIAQAVRCSLSTAETGVQLQLLFVTWHERQDAGAGFTSSYFGFPWLIIQPPALFS